MEAIKNIPGHCPRCGKPLPPDAPDQLCAACLFAAGAETLTHGVTGDESTLIPAWIDSAAAGDDAQRLEDGQVWGSYHIGRMLGRGGMGEVYEAQHARTGRRVALKVLRSRLQNSEDRARFLREGQLAASVSHPHTVYIFGSEEISGMPVISMELLPGGTLKDKVAAHGPLRPSESVAAVLDIIGGLDAAQLAGILHRDIKPSNCFLDNDGAVKVGDFGLSISTLARDVHQDLATGGFQGTPQFAAPEQLRGEPLDIRADIYAVGATLYYLLTGQAPFDARDIRELFERVLNEPPKSPRLLRREIPAGLASVVTRCLAKAPADRPTSYAVLAEMLRPFAPTNDAPARVSLRFAAGIADSLIAALLIVVWAALTGKLPTFANSTTSLWLWLFSFVYYLALESIWGTSLGKRLVGLRVIRSDGGTASWLAITCRTSIFFFGDLVFAILRTPIGSERLLTPSPSLAAVWTMAPNIVTALLFVFARQRNGWAALHDRISGTRVVSRSLSSVRNVGVSKYIKSVKSNAGSATMPQRYGPFDVVSDAGDTGNGRLFIGFDPVLRRPVWIHVVSPDTPPITNARRDVSRTGRLHWLTGRRSADESWDTYEAPDGEPFLISHASPAWDAVKLWLLDLANELAASKRDGSTPALDLNRIWLRNDGRLVLLDFPAPGVPAGLRDNPGKSDYTPVGLLSALSTHALNLNAGPPILPLSARALLNRWGGTAPGEIDDALKSFTRIAAAPDRVVWWRRAIPIAMAAAPIVVLSITALLVVTSLTRVLTPENAEMFGLLDELGEQNPSPESRLTEPEYRNALEEYWLGHYSSVIDDNKFWNSLPLRTPEMAQRRRFARSIRRRHDAVSDAELARATAIVTPELESTKQRRNNKQAGAGNVSSVVIGMLVAVSSLFALCCCLISSLIVPGGIVGRLLGLAVVRRDGGEISRAHSFARMLVTWLPITVWFGWLIAGPKIQGFVPTRTAYLPVAGLAGGMVMIGAIWAIARPGRGLHDWLSGTWVVPR